MTCLKPSPSTEGRSEDAFFENHHESIIRPHAEPDRMMIYLLHQPLSLQSALTISSSSHHLFSNYLYIPIANDQTTATATRSMDAADELLLVTASVPTIVAVELDVARKSKRAAVALATGVPTRNKPKRPKVL